MVIKSIDLGWIVVKDVKAAKDFYVNTLGFELTADAPEYNWAEVKAKDSAFVIGIGQKSDEHENDGMVIGSNTVLTLTVDNIQDAITALTAQGVKFMGDVVEVPGHVKMISFVDPDGNHMQLVEKLY